MITVRKLDHTEQTSSKIIYDVFQVSYQVEADLVGSDNFPPLQRTILEIQESNTLFYGYFQVEKLAAVLELDLSENHFHINSLVVHPIFFRQGIGGKLIDFAFEKYNPATASVETASVNEPAITLYKKMGFEKDCIYMTDVGIPKIKLSYTK
jgi:ribosomal protein S18 acetylase RimI-like enzyme